MIKKNQNQQEWSPLFFNDYFKDNWKKVSSATVPAINVIEMSEAYCVEVAAAGVTKDEFAVNLDENGNLVITMEKKIDERDEDRDVRYLRREFHYVRFQQTMVLPDEVDKDRVKAKVDNGILSINLPKLSREELAKRQRTILIS